MKTTDAALQTLARNNLRLQYKMAGLEKALDDLARRVGAIETPAPAARDRHPERRERPRRYPWGVPLSSLLDRDFEKLG